VPLQLFLEGPAGLNKQGSVNRLVRDMKLWILRVLRLQPSRDLLRRPLEPQFARYDQTQLAIRRQSALLGALRPIPRSIVGVACAIAVIAPIPPYFTTNRRRRSQDPLCNRSHGQIRRDAA